MEFDILDLGSSLFIQASDELCHGNTVVALIGFSEDVHNFEKNILALQKIPKQIDDVPFLNPFRTRS